MASSLTFLERYLKDGDEFLRHIVTGHENWVSFVNYETNEQSKQWMHTHLANKPKIFKQTLSAAKLMATLFWDRQKMSTGGGIHATRDHNYVRSISRNTKKNCVGPFRTKGVEC
jgi:hypothetical protein